MVGAGRLRQDRVAGEPEVGMKRLVEMAGRARFGSVIGVALSTALFALAGWATSAGLSPSAARAATGNGLVYLPCLLSRPLPGPGPATSTPDPSATLDASSTPVATRPKATETPTATVAPTPAEPPIPLLDQIGGPVYGLALRGDVAFVAAGSRLLAVDLADPGGPRIVGRSPVLAELAQGIGLVGDRAWLPLGAAGLAVLDIGDPMAPSLLGTSDVPSANLHGVTIADGRAYVADADGFVVVDIGEGATIRVRGAVRGLGMVSGLAAADERVFAVGARRRLDIFDASDPDRPIALGSYAGSGRIRDVAVAGDTAFLSATDRLVALDVSDPAHPREIGSVAAPASLSVALAGDLVYVSGARAAEGAGMATGVVTIVDRRDPAALMVVATLDTPDVATSLAAGPRRLAVGVRTQGIRAYDVADPVRPAPTGELSLPGYVEDVFVAGDMVYATGLRHGLWTVEAGAGRPAAVIGSLPTTWSGRAIWVEGHHAYVGADSDGLHVIDVTDPRAPVEVGQLALPGARVSSVAVAGDHAYLAAGDAGLCIVDVSDPRSPRQVATQAMPGSALWARVRGGHAYVADPAGGVVVVDVAEPAAPRIVATVAAPRDGFRPVGIALAGHHAFVAADEAGLWVIDVAKPTEPRIVGWLERLGRASRLHVEGNDAFVVNGKGLFRVDVSEPAAPVPAGYAPIGGSSRAVSATDGAVWVAALDGGLVQLDRR